MKKRIRAVSRSQSPARAARRRAKAEPTGADAILGLQVAAGNAAVALAVQRKEDEAHVATTQKESSDRFDEASAAYEAGDYRRAERIFSGLLAGRYHHREALATLTWSLAMCKARLGDFDGAYELAITYGHYGAGRADEQKLVEQIDAARREISGGAGVETPRTEDAASKLYEQAQARYEAGDYHEAARLFEALLASPVKRDDALPTVVWSLAMCKARLGDFDRATDLALQYGRFRGGSDEQQLLQRIEALRQGVDGDPSGAAIPKTLDEATAAYENASALFEAGRYEEAARAFETLLASPVKRSSALPTVVWSLAMCRAHLGDFDGARRLALTYTQYRGTADDERKLFEQIEAVQQRDEATPTSAPP